MTSRWLVAMQGVDMLELSFSYALVVQHAMLLIASATCKREHKFIAFP